jgi:hypothetical protein
MKAPTLQALDDPLSAVPSVVSLSAAVDRVESVPLHRSRRPALESSTNHRSSHGLPDESEYKSVSLGCGQSGLLRREKADLDDAAPARAQSRGRQRVDVNCDCSGVSATPARILGLNKVRAGPQYRVKMVAHA